MNSHVPLRFNAKLYQSTHRFQVMLINEVLDQFKSKINWKTANSILDIGCGPGDITNSLLSQAPDHAEMIGVDISPDMVKLASETYDDPRLKFVVGDIGDPKFGKNYEECFDIVFSTYCLHYIQNQRLAVENIYQMLRPEGETLFLTIANNPVFALDQIIAKREKWAPYMQHQKEVISPYQNSKNADLKMKDLLLETGFKIEDCFLQTVTQTWPSKGIFYKFVQSINPYLIKIPEHLHEQYFEECKKEYFSNSSLVTVSEETGEVSYSYELLIVLAKKPAILNL